MTIAHILEKQSGDTVMADSQQKVSTVASLLAEKRIGALPIIDNGKVVGIFSERDLVYGVAAKGADFLNEKVNDVMTKPAICVESDMNIMTALSLMTKRRIRHLPVVDAGVISGFVSIGDLVKYRIDRIESEAAAMRDYIQTV